MIKTTCTTRFLLLNHRIQRCCWAGFVSFVLCTHVFSTAKYTPCRRGCHCHLSASELGNRFQYTKHLPHVRALSLNGNYPLPTTANNPSRRNCVCSISSSFRRNAPLSCLHLSNTTTYRETHRTATDTTLAQQWTERNSNSPGPDTRLRCESVCVQINQSIKPLMASQPRSSRHLHLCVQLWTALASVDLRKKRATTRPTWNTNNNTRLSKTADTDKLTAKRSPTLRASSGGFQTNTLAHWRRLRNAVAAPVWVCRPGEKGTRSHENGNEKKRAEPAESIQSPLDGGSFKRELKMSDLSNANALTPATAFATVKANLLG